MVVDAFRATKAELYGNDHVHDLDGRCVKNRHARPCVTPLEVARKALELADENPDARGDCNYLTYDLDDQIVGGNCLFGQALLALGVDAEDLRRYEGSSIEAVLLRLAGDPSESPITALTYAQFYQDEGKRWGDPEIRGHLVEYIEAHS